jgi:hypothetical protein
MSHVDEGTLHAYLDGALDSLPAAQAEQVRRHLAMCGECQARLEEERALRDEASAILGGVALDVGDLPAFEDLRAMAAARAAPSASPGSRLRRVAWAASVVLAMGTGWFLRGGVPQPSRTLERMDHATEAAAPPDAAVSDEALTDRLPSDEPAADATAGPPALEASTRGSAAPEAGAPAEGVAPPPTRGAARTTAGADQTSGGGVSEPGARVAGGDAPAAPPPVAQRFPPSQASAKLAVERDPAFTLSAIAEPDSAAGPGRGLAGDSADAAPLLTPADLWAAVQQERRADAVPSSTAIPIDVARRADQRSAEAQRERRFVAPSGAAVPAAAGEPTANTGSLVVPGLTVVLVTRLEEPELAGAVRVLQLLETGDTLELVHLPAGVDPGLLPAVGDGRTQLLAPRDGGWLVVRARASAEVLSALLARLGGGL